MKIRIKIKKELEEISVAGAVVGHSAPLRSQRDDESDNKNEGKNEPLTDLQIDEMMSTSTGKDVVRVFSVEDENAAWRGTQERAAAQGNRAITEEDEPTEPMEPTEKTIDNVIENELIKNGFKPLGQNETRKFLGGGMFGGVYEAVQADNDYLGAIKVIRAAEADIDREIRNYRKVSQARSKDPLIAKHFPETFKTWKSVDEKGKPIGFIFMEKLGPVSPDAKQQLPDRAYWRSMRGKATRLTKDLEVDISKRAEIYFKSEKFFDLLSSHLNKMSEDVDFDLKKALAELDLSTMSRLDRQADSTMNKKILYSMFEEAEALAKDKNLTKSLSRLKFLLEDLMKSRFSQLALLRVFNIFAKYGEDRIVQGANLWMPLDNEIKGILDSILKGTREETLTYGHYDKRKRLDPKQAGKKSGVEAGVLALYDKTGLYARDLHSGNFLSRPSGELVVVDLGLFKMGRELRKRKVKESRQYRIKLLTNPTK
jgi:serine/threonine protein kinase